MSHANTFSLARVLAAPWQQRCNAGGLWGLALIAALCAVAPVSLSIWSLLANPALAESLHEGVKRSAMLGIAALLIAGWAILVSNVLQQNHPTLASLVPGHVGRLRGALLVVWALLVLVAAGVPGFLFDAPLAWACGMAVALLFLAAALRWPPLWLPGIAMPFLMSWFLGWRGHGAVSAALYAQWQSADWLVMAIVATAGVAVLTLLIRTGGTIHGTSYDMARQLGRIMSTGFVDGVPTSLPGWWRHLGSSIARPCARWMQHLLTREDSSVMSRLLVGLGPATHWTTRIFEAFWYMALMLVVCVVIGGILGGGDTIAFLLPFLCFSVLTGVCSPALQAVSRLHQSGREQALLVLLPGVPRGARLNRWLGLQMSLTFVVAALFGLAMAWALAAYADALKPGMVENTVYGMVPALAAALLPQVAWQWRCWARLRGARGTRETMPTIASMLLGAAFLALHAVTGIGYATLGVASTAASLLWCAWRWHRMGGEPTAFPVGRLG